MDNPATESGALDTNQAAAAFASLLSDEPVKQEQPAQAEAQAESEEDAAVRIAAEEAQAETQSEPESEAKAEEPRYTVKIDGKDVEVTLDELRNGYQRQQDYTRKTMEISEARKQAEAEYTQARQERQQYANTLQDISQKLGAALQEQSQINWVQLAESDPAEFVRQKALYDERQAAFQRAQAEQARVFQQQQAEQAKFVQSYLSEQQQELLAKLPEWKDEAKAKAEKAKLAEYLTNTGFSPDEVGKIADHRLVLLARDAMRYRDLMSKAQAASKKVEKLPPKVERPGNGEASKPDGRTAAMQRLSKSGRVEDAAAVFAQFL